MNKLFLSIIAVFVVLSALLLFQASKAGTSVVMLPTEVLAKANQEQTLSRIRVAGRVADAEVNYIVEPNFELKFFIENPPKPGVESQAGILAVVYQGIKPDMFAPGRDVIIDGEFRGGTLYASKLLTQCPSKYEPPKPGAAQPENQKPDGMQEYQESQQ